jgi:hypothetical protein
VTLPVLIDCPSDDEVDGFTFRRTSGTETGCTSIPIRIVPFPVLERVEKAKGVGELQTRYGVVSGQTRAALLAINRLVQAILTKDSSQLESYIRLKAESEANEEARFARQRQLTLADAPVLFRPMSPRPASVIREVVRERVHSPGHPVAELINELYQRSSGRLVGWWDHRRRVLSDGLYCRKLDSALFTLLLSRVAMPQGTAICARCGTVFQRSRVAQKFCSTRCGNFVRQIKRRAKQKGKTP